MKRLHPEWPYVQCLSCGHEFDPWNAKWARPEEQADYTLIGPAGSYIECPQCGRFDWYKLLQDIPPDFSGVTRLPPNYPAYCVLFESGMREDFELALSSTLRTWGEKLGVNVFVAPWDIGDSTFVDQVRRLGLGPLPAIVLSEVDVSSPTARLADSVYIRIDYRPLLANLDKMMEILPLLVNQILAGESKQAVKEAIRARRRDRLETILRKLGSVFKGVKLSFGYGGAHVDVQLKEPD